MMTTPTSSLDATFDLLVRKRYNVYNGIFLNLPFENISSTGMLISGMNEFIRTGLEKGKEPREILENYFITHTRLKSEKEKIDFMFRVIQYVERQIVLFDSIEDAAFPFLHEAGNSMSILDYIHMGQTQYPEAAILEKLSSFSVRLVFTAHPTQFYPPAVLDIIGHLKSLVDQNDLNGIDLSLQQLGMTSLLKSTKPTPLEEAKNIIYYLRHVYYDAIGKLYKSIKEHYPEGKFENPGLLRIGFWPGGDRDGNPYVTADITRKVADELRMTLMKCYYQDIKALEKKMTFRGVEETISTLRARIYECMFDPSVMLDTNEIQASLMQVRDTIIMHYNKLYLEDLDSFIDKVKIFRTHFATLDIRQDHRVHKKAVEEILKKQNFIKEKLEELSKDELLKILLSSSFTIDPDQFQDTLVRDTILNIAQLKSIQETNGEWGCNRYIISNAEDIYSVVFVYALFRWCGWKEQEISFDIVPLFETMQGMEAGAAIMEELFNIRQYKDHLSLRNNEQTIMLGFSDGTKDGGYLKANWSIFKTKEELTTICERHGVKVVFFDGRGGPPARGGGKSHRFYSAQSGKIANHEIQLTVQGQTITSRYGTGEQFIYNCDQLLTAGLAREIAGKTNCIPDESRKLLEELSDISYRKYLALKAHDKFLPYLLNKSTLKYYSEANVGSRPAARGNSKTLNFKDLRAIPYVGSWSQLKQNVPGYYGLGSALKSMEQAGKLGEMKKLFHEVPYFKALVLNSMMSLSKCNFQLTSYLGKDPVYKDFWKLIHDEYLLTKEMVLIISGYASLMEEEPVTRNSIEIREQIVLPLLLIQQYAMQKVETGSAQKPNYEKMIKRSLYGNINASRNSV